MSYVEDLLGKNEKIIVRTRQHWTVLARSLGGNLFFTFLIVLLVIGVTVFLANPLGIIALVLLFLPGALVARDYLAWMNEEYFVTNHRVIQTEGIVNKHVIDSSLEKVNDVVLYQSFWGRIFDYGDIEILTASESGINKLKMISQPIVFKTQMLDQKESFGRRDEMPAPTGNRARDIPALIAALDDLRQQGVVTEEEFQRKKAELLSKL
jgi:uncharacterized membrane protein YdbT with pleckstrin-like domain